MSQQSENSQQPQGQGGWFLYMLKLVEVGMRPALEDALAAHGFTTSQYTALSVLRTRPGITSSELARRSFVRAQSMAETVAYLQERELIRREQDPTHARRLLLHPTEKALQALAAVEEPVTRAESAILAGLDDSARAELASILRTLRHNIQWLNDSAP